MVFLAVPVALYNGMMMTFMWRWFLVPFGVPAIGVAHACGLFLLVGMFTYSFTREKFDPEHPMLNGYVTILFSVLCSSLLTGFGWIFHSFM
jgi:hypothetical protein